MSEMVIIELNDLQDIRGQGYDNGSNMRVHKAALAATLSILWQTIWQIALFLV